MLQGAQQIENAVWEYRLILPYAVMGVTAVLVAVSQWPLVLSAMTIAGSGAATYGAVKLGELYSLGKDMMTKVDKDTLPLVNQTLDDAKKILDEFEHVGSEVEHPLNSIGQAIEGRTQSILNGFKRLFQHKESEAPDVENPRLNKDSSKKKKVAL
ncbi:MAG: hypothetical protein BGO43_00735 [Gammaproteobacteria bacterium 39-13]|nr:hypothetical protein [Gammaproteobacteria bacterium]OJV96782.1 MAG: hypothetical protein BGO43_00735 [Gammaproteobacteria bacterium 39-13]